jgi:hypothetical protein
MVKKLLKKSSKSNVSRKTTNKTNKKSKRSSKRSSKTLSKRKFVKKMKGGDAGRYVMPPSYYGSGNAGYFPEGSPELETSSKQHAVSQGMVWDNGKFAGPNLYPTMTGAGCGCSRKYKTHIKKNKHTKKTKKHSKK